MALETKAELQLLLLPHSLFPCVHGMLRYTPRRKERMDVLVLRKGTGAVTLGGTVERAQLFLPYDSVRSSQSTEPRVGKVPTTAKI